MVKRLKEGEQGPSTHYITRARALKKLQVSLADFRRMCIIKGVYPRQPNRMLKGADKTYYHIKDINYLASDPIKAAIYEKQAAEKKARKLVARGEKPRARALEKRVGEMDLTHIVRERYPTFESALEDLDDCLCTLALFAALPADLAKSIDPVSVRESAKLYDDFLLYVTSTGRLRKVFASIKGFYFQAELPGGIAVTWLQPHRFAPTMPEEVDFKVLVTFDQWYRTLQKFVNFKLYSMEGWSYPPTVPASIRSGITVGTQFALMKLHAKVKEVVSAESEEKGTGSSSLFKNFTFFISRECQFLPLALVIRSAGGRVCWAEDEAKSSMDSEGVTHVVIDRPGEITKLPDREYIQPQWVFDSFNEQISLPIAEYTHGAELPPHLSPFAPEGDNEYIPQRRQVLNALIAKRKLTLAKAVANELGEDITDELEAIAAIQKEKEALEAIRLEKLGEAAKLRRQERTEERLIEDKIKQAVADKREQAKALMSKKHRRLLQRIETTANTKSEVVDKLKKRAESIAAVSNKSKKISKK
jgi:pescadillo protein